MFNMIFDNDQNEQHQTMQLHIVLMPIFFAPTSNRHLVFHFELQWVQPKERDPGMMIPGHSHGPLTVEQVVQPQA